MVVKGVGCDLFVASGRPLRGECRPRGVYRGLRSPAALASPVLSVDPAVFTTAADARQLASSARQWSAVRARRRKQKTEGLKFAGGIGKGRYTRGGRGRRQIEVGTTSTFVLREETGSPCKTIASLLQNQGLHEFLLNMRAYSEFRCHLIFLKSYCIFSQTLNDRKILY